ncbi:hypothetical protein Hanom_Chr01g00085651 [Helianthus anomalus]
MELTSQMKMARFQTFGSRCRKTNLWTKVTKLAKPQGRKWHFTSIEKITIPGSHYHHHFHHDCSQYHPQPCYQTVLSSQNFEHL